MGVLIVIGCGRRIPITVGPVIPEDELLQRQADAAFHEGTPEGYTRAVSLFQRASDLNSNRCEYALARAQALLFLASEQQSNWEEFEPQRTEALRLIDSSEFTCPTSEGFTSRLRAFVLGLGPDGDAKAKRALELDSAEAMNWLAQEKTNPVGLQHEPIARAGELRPDSALIQFELANSKLYDKPREAREIFERVVRLNPRHFRAYLGLAYTAAEDETVDVESFYRKVVEIAPDFLEGRMALGNYYAGIEDVGKATDEYNAALAANRRYDVAYFRLGLIAMSLGLNDEAESRFKSVVQLNPMSYEAYYYLGNILYAKRDLANARLQYELALKYRTNYVDPIYGLGTVFHDLGQDDLALTQFEQVIRLSPQYAGAYFSRAVIRAGRRQLFDAFADLQKSIQLYEQQIRQLDATIAYAEAHPQSRLTQGEGKRAVRDKALIAGALERARQYKTEVEQQMSQRF
jgi:tetratricopeptide (TPR) repeat protein